MEQQLSEIQRSNLKAWADQLYGVAQKAAQGPGGIWWFSPYASALGAAKSLQAASEAHAQGFANEVQVAQSEVRAARRFVGYLQQLYPMTETTLATDSFVTYAEQCLSIAQVVV